MSSGKPYSLRRHGLQVTEAVLAEAHTPEYRVLSTGLRNSPFFVKVKYSGLIANAFLGESEWNKNSVGD